MNYRMTLSNKEVLELTQEDYDKFEQYSGSGNFIKLSHGVVNPSFVVSIIPTSKDLPKHPRLEQRNAREGSLANVGEFRPSFLKSNENHN